MDLIAEDNGVLGSRWHTFRGGDLPGVQTIKCDQSFQAYNIYMDGKYVAKVIYRPKGELANKVIALTEHCLQTPGDIKGRSRVTRRHEQPVQGKMYSFGTPTMFCQPEGGSLQCYKMNHGRCYQMERLVSGVADGLALEEWENFVEAAVERSQLMQIPGAQKLKLSDNSNAFSMAVTKAFWSKYHQEPSNETVLLCSSGSMEPGTWRFAIENLVFELPTCGTLETLLWMAPDVRHGTLPYTGTMPHLGYGVVISNEHDVIMRLRNPKSPTRPEDTAAFIFTAPKPPNPEAVSEMAPPKRMMIDSDDDDAQPRGVHQKPSKPKKRRSSDSDPDWHPSKRTRAF